MNTTGSPSSRRSLIQAVLSALLPGLGHLLAGRRRAALLWSLPHLLLVGALLLVLGRGREAILLAFDTGVLLLGAVALLGIGAWRLAAGISAAGIRRTSGRTLVAATLALSFLIGAAGPAYGALLALEARNGILAVFGGELADGFYDGLGDRPVPLLPSSTPTPTATPHPFAGWDDDGLLTLLLIGGDAGPGRWSRRTDTMILLQVDPQNGRAAMTGLPRNLTGVPLPPESAGVNRTGRFGGLLNALYAYAEGRPKFFPGADGVRGFLALERTIENLAKVEIDGMIAVDLQGMVRIIDALGGVKIRVTESIYDARLPKPDGSGYVVFRLKRGLQTLNGFDFLGYVRSRHQDSDYGRMRRQQAALLSLRSALDPIALLPRASELIAAARGALWTNLPPEALPILAGIADGISADDVQRAYITPAEGFPIVLDDAAIRRIPEVIAAAIAAPPVEPSPSPSTTPSPAP